MKKVEIEVNNLLSKNAQKIPMINQIVIITTISNDGNINAAIKSSVIHAISEPPIFGFSCNLSHHTSQNILEQHDFVINIPGEDIIEQVATTSIDYPVEVNELEKAGLSSIPSKVVKPPRIEECVTHFECREEWHKIYDNDILIFGKVVATSIDKDLYNLPIEERFPIVKPVVMLGEKRYSPVIDVKKIPFPDSTEL